MPNQSKNYPTLIYIRDILKVMKRQHQNLEFGHNLGEIHSQKKLEKESILAFKGGLKLGYDILR